MTDIVNLTYGINIGIFERTLITFGVVTPVTSPKPFDFEAMAFVNYFFGPSAPPATDHAAGAGWVLKRSSVKNRGLLSAADDGLARRGERHFDSTAWPMLRHRRGFGRP